MEMGKHIIVFITAILMPFMAYGDNCSDITDPETCNTTPGCGASLNGMITTCTPCGASTYNAKDNDNNGCIACTNAPAHCGTELNSRCTWIGDETKPSNNFVFSGLTSNTCPWEMDVTMSVSYLDSEHPNISATLSNVDDGDTTGNEKKLVIKIDNTENKFSTISDSFNNNQIDSVKIKLDDNTECTINSMGYNANQWKLVSNDCSLSEESETPKQIEISSPLLTVTAKKFKYVLVPRNSVEDDNNFSVVSAGNASDVKEGFFGAKIDLENTEYYQYNNCKYYETKKEASCEVDQERKPEDASNQIKYNFTYIDKYTDAYDNPIDAIIVLERATECQAGKYCQTYTTNKDEDCPGAFWSDKNAISITDCYLDSKVKFIDNNNNNTNGVQLIPKGTKVYYQGNPTQ